MREKAQERKKSEIFVTVSGSFNQALPQIQRAISRLSELGIIVLSPKIAAPVSRVNGFVILEKDKGTFEQIEKGHLTAILRSDLLYIVNPSGYIGNSVAMEIGYAWSYQIPIYASECPTDELFRNLLHWGISLNTIKSQIERRKSKIKHSRLGDSPNLADLQTYVSRMVKLRGFSDETLAEVALLLFEEVGELSKAIRIESGLKVSEDVAQNGKSLRNELADCLFYLLDMANLAGIDLEDALREKEEEDSKRKWTNHVSWIKETLPSMQIALLRFLAMRFLESGPKALASLTAKESALLKAIADGYSVEQLDKRFISPERSLEKDMASILDKLSVTEYSSELAAKRMKEDVPNKRLKPK